MVEVKISKQGFPFCSFIYLYIYFYYYCFSFDRFCQFIFKTTQTHSQIANSCHFLKIRYSLHSHILGCCFLEITKSICKLQYIFPIVVNISVCYDGHSYDRLLVFLKVNNLICLNNKGHFRFLFGYVFLETLISFVHYNGYWLSFAYKNQ